MEAFNQASGEPTLKDAPERVLLLNGYLLQGTDAIQRLAR